MHGSVFVLCGIAFYVAKIINLFLMKYWSSFLKNNGHHLAILLGLCILAVAYCKPAISGKTLLQHDVVQAKSAAQEILKYKETSGKHALWSTTMFSGMPSYTIVGHYPNSWTSSISSAITYLLPEPINMLFLLFACAYLAFVFLGFKWPYALLGSIGYGLASYTLISLEAGHISKVIAIAYAPPVVAGFVLLYREKWLKGSLVFLIAMVLQLYANHVQITYYLFMALGLFALVQLVEVFRKRQRFIDYAKATGIAAAIVVITIASFASKLWTLSEYSAYTMRGTSDLKKAEGQANKGLDKDYAFGWSYGIAETFTYIIPDFYGGKSNAVVPEDSRIVKTLKEHNMNGAGLKDAEAIPLYWGAQPGTSGPAYFGIVFMFFALLGLFVIPSVKKWWLAAVILLFTLISWGGNLPWFSNMMFDYFPLYNKFRAVTMIHAPLAFFIGLLGLWGLYAWMELKDEAKAKRSLYISGGALAGLLVLFMVMGSSFFSFKNLGQEGEEGDRSALLQVFESYAKQDPELIDDLLVALYKDRASAMRSDALRSFLFLAVAIGILWMVNRKMMKAEIALYIIIPLVLLDLWGIDRRYLNDNDFKKAPKIASAGRGKNREVQYVKLTQADRQMLADQSQYRVFNLAVSPFNDATTSYYHHSIGGYSAAKMQRYQDVISDHLQPEINALYGLLQQSMDGTVDSAASVKSMPVMNMLNTKYVVVPMKEGTYPFLNKGARGAAWFVDTLLVVEDARKELDGLKGLGLNKALTEKTFSNVFTKPVYSGVGSIKVAEYTPDLVRYQVEASADALMVMSEIYYEKGWQAYLDGKPVPHGRVNYLLRGMEVPAGKHEVKFEFRPESYYTGEVLALTGSILTVIGIGVCAFLMYRQKGDDETQAGPILDSEA